MAIVVLLLVVLALVLLFLAAVGVGHPRINFLAAGLFCFVLAWALAGPFGALHAA